MVKIASFELLLPSFFTETLLFVCMAYHTTILLLRVNVLDCVERWFWRANLPADTQNAKISTSMSAVAVSIVKLVSLPTLVFEPRLIGLTSTWCEPKERNLRGPKKSTRAAEAK